MRAFPVLLCALAALLATACGVTAQDEPQPLLPSSESLAPTPTLTQRPDPTTTTPSSETAPVTGSSATRQVASPPRRGRWQ
ncbi:hypothetical protein [Saccharothrix obliqua]|uniref:hypothetical protein n=1 Tax=Saccharothrix obliqua TaxID=2861747 RepID=UPI001C5FF674|nr:hypothetical protein [Saccharothrix obliqua]MBW4720494.1 hypothetical protein [Saccharothrix obliqua]